MVAKASYWGMEEIGQLLERIMPEVPDDLLSAETLAPLWAGVANGALARTQPLGYCHGRLFVGVPGSAFAARLREEAPRLLVALQATRELAGLREIVVRPLPAVPAAGPRARPLRPASGADCVQALALAVDDEALRRSLARLAASIRGGGDSRDPVV